MYQLGCIPFLQKTLTSQFTQYSTHQHGRFCIILVHVCVLFVFGFHVYFEGQSFLFYTKNYTYIYIYMRVYIYIWCFCLLWKCLQSQKHHCELSLWGSRNPKQQRSPNHQQFLCWRLACKCTEDEISVLGPSNTVVPRISSRTHAQKDGNNRKHMQLERNLLSKSSITVSLDQLKGKSTPETGKSPKPG